MSDGTYSNPKSMSLHSLSSEIMAIISGKKNTNLREVTELVVRSCSKTSDPSSDTTTKRRVYDVLNVFMAAGLIEKGKVIKLIPPKQITDDLEMNKQEREAFLSCKKKQKELVEKVRILLYYKALIEKNEKEAKPEKSIPLPAIFLTSHVNQTKKISKQGNDLNISLSHVDCIFSPEDIFLPLNLNMESQKEFLQNNEKLTFLKELIFTD